MNEVTELASVESDANVEMDMPADITVEQAVINFKSKLRSLSKNDLIRNFVRFYMDNMSLHQALNFVKADNLKLREQLKQQTDNQSKESETT